MNALGCSQASKAWRRHSGYLSAPLPLPGCAIQASLSGTERTPFEKKCLYSYLLALLPACLTYIYTRTHTKKLIRLRERERLIDVHAVYCITCTVYRIPQAACRIPYIRRTPYTGVYTAYRIPYTKHAYIEIAVAAWDRHRRIQIVLQIQPCVRVEQKNVGTM